MGFLLVVQPAVNCCCRHASVVLWARKRGVVLQGAAELGQAEEEEEEVVELGQVEEGKVVRLLLGRTYELSVASRLRDTNVPGTVPPLHGRWKRPGARASAAAMPNHTTTLRGLLTL